MRPLGRLIGVGAIALSLAACQAANQPKLVESQKSPVELRALQSRAFETTNREKTLRAVIATLQDLGYSIDKVEPSAGTITGTKLSQLRLTATVHPRGESRMMVRANAIVRMPQQTIETQVDDPLFYQQLFFEPLAKAMFLSALQVEDPGEPPAPAGATAATAIAPQSATNSKQGN